MQNTKGININPYKSNGSPQTLSKQKQNTQHRALSTLKFPNQERQPNLDESFSSSYLFQHLSLYFPFVT